MTSNAATATDRRLDELLLKTSRTFALSIPVLPEPTRREVTLAYLLFRVADTLEDATRWSRNRQIDELERLSAVLERPEAKQARELAQGWVDDPPLAHPGYLELLAEFPSVLEAFGELTPAARSLITRHVCRTAERMARFVGRDEGVDTPLRDLDELKAYCYAVAGIVGEMLTELFLLEREELEPVADALRRDAACFGEALQLVNILKDSAVDAGEGRRYLPSGNRLDVLILARQDLLVAGRYMSMLERAGTDRGLVAFTALPILLAWNTLVRFEREGPGAKLTRDEVLRIATEMERAIDDGNVAELWNTVTRHEHPVRS